MSDSSPRAYRVADQIQKDLAALIRAQVKDPRLSQFVVIEEVRVSRDLSVATIYISTLDDKGEESQQVLNRAAGFLRRELARRIRIRSIPELRFVYDALSKDAQQISSLIHQAIAADEAAHGEEDSKPGDEEEQG